MARNVEFARVVKEEQPVLTLARRAVGHSSFEQLVVVQRQINNLFQGFKHLENSWDSQERSKGRNQRENSKSVGGEILALVLCFVSLWDGGSMEGVPEELKSEYVKIVKRQIVSLVENPHDEDELKYMDIRQKRQRAVELEGLRSEKIVTRMIQTWGSDSDLNPSRLQGMTGSSHESPPRDWQSSGTSSEGKILSRNSPAGDLDDYDLLSPGQNDDEPGRSSLPGFSHEGDDSSLSGFSSVDNFISAPNQSDTDEDLATEIPELIQQPMQIVLIFPSTSRTSVTDFDFTDPGLTPAFTEQSPGRDAISSDQSEGCQKMLCRNLDCDLPDDTVYAGTCDVAADEWDSSPARAQETPESIHESLQDVESLDSFGESERLGGNSPLTSSEQDENLPTSSSSRRWRLEDDDSSSSGFFSKSREPVDNFIPAPSDSDTDQDLSRIWREIVEQPDVNLLPRSRRCLADYICANSSQASAFRDRRDDRDAVRDHLEDCGKGLCCSNVDCVLPGDAVAANTWVVAADKDDSSFLNLRIIRSPKKAKRCTKKRRKRYAYFSSPTFTPEACGRHQRRLLLGSPTDVQLRKPVSNKFLLCMPFLLPSKTPRKVSKSRRRLELVPT